MSTEIQLQIYIPFFIQPIPQNTDSCTWIRAQARNQCPVALDQTTVMATRLQVDFPGAGVSTLALLIRGALEAGSPSGHTE